MSKFAAIVVTAAVCLPLGALLHSDATAQPRISAFGYPPMIDGHPHLSQAQAALRQALNDIEASERANEALWSDQTGRATATKAAIENAALTMDRTADWVTSGMAVYGQGSPMIRWVWLPGVGAPRSRP